MVHMCHNSNRIEAQGNNHHRSIDENSIGIITIVQ